MNKIKRKSDLLLAPDKRQACLREIATFFKQERGETLGLIATEEILDFFLENVGGTIYNKGVEDSKELLKKRFEDFGVDLDLLLNK